MCKFISGLPFNLNALKPFVSLISSENKKVQIGTSKHCNEVRL